MTDLAARAGTSSTTIARLEKGDPGVAIGTLADILVALGLINRLADLIDIRNDDLGLALIAERAPRHGRSSAMSRRKRDATAESNLEDIVDPDGIAF